MGGKYKENLKTWNFGATSSSGQGEGKLRQQCWKKVELLPTWLTKSQKIILLKHGFVQREPCFRENTEHKRNLLDWIINLVWENVKDFKNIVPVKSIWSVSTRLAMLELPKILESWTHPELVLLWSADILSTLYWKISWSFKCFHIVPLIFSRDSFRSSAPLWKNKFLKCLIGPAVHMNVNFFLQSFKFTNLIVLQSNTSFKCLVEEKDVNNFLFSRVFTTKRACSQILVFSAFVQPGTKVRLQFDLNLLSMTFFLRKVRVGLVSNLKKSFQFAFRF